MDIKQNMDTAMNSVQNNINATYKNGVANNESIYNIPYPILKSLIKFHDLHFQMA